MTEWGVVGVLVVLVGLFGALAKPLIKWNVSLTENTMATKALTDAMKNYEKQNEKEHSEIWTELGEHDKRIINIETKRGAG